MTSSSNRQRVVAAAGGTAARICEGCKDRRARWYCAPDDAFLCQICDISVHSANPLARRHRRLQINVNAEAQAGNATDPAWPQFKRKPRTPRHRHHAKGQSVFPVQQLVPELELLTDENNEEEESQLLYRVPILDPEFFPLLDQEKSAIQQPNISHRGTTTTDNHGPVITEFDLEDFSANIDSLLGQEGESFFMDEVSDYCIGESREVKLEIGEDNTMPQIYGECNVILQELGRIKEEDNSSETLEFDFAECGSPEANDDNVSAEQPETRMSLRLDYEAIIAEWSKSHGLSPWMDGQRPQLSPDEYFWTDYMQQNMWNGGVPVQIEGGVDDREREARVLRYREKRRRRLFSKKIRYEVRKLNAEKRPRMKGRFVKKSNFTPRPTL